VYFLRTNQADEMKIIGLLSSVALAVGLVASTTQLVAHETGPGGSPERLIVTRHFTGVWDQVDQEAQGIALEVIEQFDDSRRAVGYWFTYGADRKTAWFLGVGDLIDDRIEFELYESTNI
jgi:hypothetical protein